jgi:hypothetical protein
MKKIIVEKFVTDSGTSYDTKSEAVAALISVAKAELWDLLARYDVPEAKALASKIVTVELAEENVSIQYIGGLMRDASTVEED